MTRLIKTLSISLFAALVMASPTQAAKQDIVDIAAGAGTFNTLVAAVTAADLVSQLKSPGPFTVFAPTDDAFAKLPSGTVEMLLRPENKNKLIAILTYHIVPGKVMSSDIAGKTMMVPSAQGQMISVNASSGVMVNDATVVSADIEASNGVIHVIDRVILPPSS